MRLVKAVRYSLKWKIKENTGTVRFELENGKEGEIPLDSIGEFQVVSYILKNSKEVSLDFDERSIVTNLVPIGS